MTVSLVTGAAGHLGNTLVRELLFQGETLRAVVLPDEDISALSGLNVPLFNGDIRDLASLKRCFNGADFVYHLAAMISVTPAQPSLMTEVNFKGTRNVIEACLASGVRRLVYASSVHALKEPPEGTVIDENCPFAPDEVQGYARTKAQASLAVIDATKRGLDAVMVCPSGVIGPNDFRSSEMGRFIQEFAKGGMKAYVDGAYDFVDVRDVARGMVLACRYGRTGQAYILSGERMTMQRFVEVLQMATGAADTPVRIPLRMARMMGSLATGKTGATPAFAGSINVLAGNSRMSSEKARHELGYTARAAAESLVDALAWLRENGRV